MLACVRVRRSHGTHTHTHTHTQSVTGYYRVCGCVPDDDNYPTPQQALDYVVEATPSFLALVRRSGETGRLMRRTMEDTHPTRFNVLINGFDGHNRIDFTAWIVPESMDITNEATIEAALVAGAPLWSCSLRAGGEWSGMLTHTQLVSMTAVMDALQDSPQEAERYLRSVVMV